MNGELEVVKWGKRPHLSIRCIRVEWVPCLAYFYGSVLISNCDCCLHFWLAANNRVTIKLSFYRNNSIINLFQVLSAPDGKAQWRSW